MQKSGVNPVPGFAPPVRHLVEKFVPDAITLPYLIVFLISTF